MAAGARLMAEPRQPGDGHRARSRRRLAGAARRASRSASSAGDRIGVVGLNGGGKTTLLDILTGRARARRAAGSAGSAGCGSRTSRRATTLPAGAPGCATSCSARYGAEHEWAADPQVRDVLDGLGLHDLDRTVDGLSGGEKRRVALAAALVGDLDLVVLDEPTNHLDVEGIGWLAEHLIARRCAVVVVTHDRWFLDAVCTRTWEVAGGRVESYLGGYADWVFARAERGRQADAAEARRQNLARKELAWLRRGPPARTSKPRYRIEAAEALIADVPPPRDTVELLGFATQPARAHGAGAGGRDGRGSAAARCSTASPGGSGRATGSGSSGSTARARRRCCAR